MPKKNKKLVKITEVPAKIKIISEESSELEREIKSAEKEEIESFGSAQSGNFQAPILTPSEISEQRPVTAVQQRQETEFSQSRIYSTNAIQQSEVRKTYVSHEESARRFTPTIQSQVNFNPQRQHVDFKSPESQNSQERDYNQPVDLGEVKKENKRRPWE